MLEVITVPSPSKRLGSKQAPQTQSGSFESLDADEAMVRQLTRQLTRQVSMQSAVSVGRVRAVETIANVGLVHPLEIRGWYVYDWSFSPYYQVADILFKWMLKRLAENAEQSGEYRMGGMTAGSYPANVLLVMSIVQVISLLSFSAFGDYGRMRKPLLMLLTYMCCIFLGMCYLCTSSSLWWMAGLLRIAAGCCFVLTNVYYNAYLPLLTSQNPEVLTLHGVDSEKKEAALADDISAKGFACGYWGGMTMQIITYLMLLKFECKSDCTDYDRLRWITLAIALSGLWWALFSSYSFKHLKVRPGSDFPKDESVFCLGWKDTWRTLREVARLSNTRLYVLGYFIWSDALATAVNLSQLLMDDSSGDEKKDGGEDLDSTKFVLLIGATLACLLGVFLFMRIARTFNLSSKQVLMLQLCIFGVLCTACALGALGISNAMYFVCMVPMMLMLGSLQANQRSLYSSLSPVGKEASMFAFYTITDKGSSIIGYAVIGAVHNWTHSYVGAFWYCAIAFFVSAWILSIVDIQQGMRDAGKGGDEELTSPSESQVF